MSRDWKWDWWSENPVELVIFVLFLSMFFAFPYKGMGITPKSEEISPAPTPQQ